MKTLSSIITSFLMFLTSQIGISQQLTKLEMASPDGSIIIQFRIVNGKAEYSVSKSGKEVIRPSSLGFEFHNMPDFITGIKLVGSRTSSFDQTWEQPWGETRFIRNHYNELVVELTDNTSRKLNIIFRAFNDGIGFRYEIPKQADIDSIVIKNEVTAFNFPTEQDAWWIPVHSENSFYESLYRKTPMGAIDTANTPITIETKDGLFLAIHEANLTDYASMTLRKIDNTHFVSDLVPWSNGMKVYAKAPMVTPWRTILIAEKAGDLLTSYLMLNLNEPNKLGDVSWVKPAKYIGIWWGMHLEKYSWAQGPKHGATTENTKKYIDFAAENGFAGVLVEGWNYGWDGNWFEDGSSFSFTKPYPDFDMEQICAYGASKNVKLIGHHETGGAAKNYENQLDEAFKLYNKVGVSAVKTGYVNKYLDGKEWHDGQYGVRHYRKIFETAAAYHIMIDNHEPVKPTGLCRTYPNFMTQEGARGQEYDAWSSDGGNPPSHTVILPFTRMLAGPLDFTPGTFSFTNPVKPGSRVQTTLAKQLGMYMIIYSPQQMASDLPENYQGQKAFDFIKSVPCDWDDTKVLNAEIGKYVTIARKDRNSENWYVGSITNEAARELSINLSFLDPKASYTAQIYADGADADWKTNPLSVAISEQTVTATSVLVLKLAAGGGQAIRLVKN